MSLGDVGLLRLVSWTDVMATEIVNHCQALNTIMAEIICGSKREGGGRVIQPPFLASTMHRAQIEYGDSRLRRMQPAPGC